MSTPIDQRDLSYPDAMRERPGHAGEVPRRVRRTHPERGATSAPRRTGIAPSACRTPFPPKAEGETKTSRGRATTRSTKRSRGSSGRPGTCSGRSNRRRRSARSSPAASTASTSCARCRTYTRRGPVGERQRLSWFPAPSAGDHLKQDHEGRLAPVRDQRLPAVSARCSNAAADRHAGGQAVPVIHLANVPVTGLRKAVSA
jgi:hypothetical protein